jgi:hypothetical protein
LENLGKMGKIWENLGKMGKNGKNREKMGKNGKKYFPLIHFQKESATPLCWLNLFSVERVIFYLEITTNVEFHGIIDKKNDAGIMHM